MLLHWGIALLLVPMLFFGEELMEEDGGALLPSLHVSIGVTILVLSVLRLIWRVTHPAPPLPAGSPAWETTAAKVTHVLFYVLMIGLPLTGWLALPHFMAEEPGLAGVTAFGMSLPQLPDIGLPAKDLHEIGQKIGIGLLVLHVAAALKHQFVNRDNLMKRMMPHSR
jgi:cytochrome b561